MTSPSEPLYGQPLGQPPLSPAPPQRWTPPFLFLLTLIALLGGVATLFGLLGNPLGGPYISPEVDHLFSGSQAGLALRIVFLVVYLVGVWFARNILLRAAFLITIVTTIISILIALPLADAQLQLPAGLDDSLFSLALSPLFELALGVLRLAAQICLSYGLARWRPSDKVFIWVQLLLTLGLGFAIFLSRDLSRYADQPDFFLLYALGPFLSIASLVCLLCRSACWRTHRLIILCFTIGSIAPLLFNDVIERFFYAPSALLLFLQASTAIGLISSTIFLLGLLLLIQEQRLQKKAQIGGLAAQEAV